jgi:hypothetical protein
MAVVFPYVKNTAWADGSGGGTPVTAAKLNVYEDGIFNAHQQPAVRVFRNTTQSIANGTATAVQFNAERFDTAGGAASTMHDTVTNNTRLTCRYAGKYMITGHIEWAGSPNTGTMLFLLNATTTIAQIQVPGDFRIMSLCTIYDLAVNDFVELQVAQSSGGALNVASTSARSPEFAMVRTA